MRLSIAMALLGSQVALPAASNQELEDSLLFSRIEKGKPVNAFLHGSNDKNIFLRNRDVSKNKKKIHRVQEAIKFQEINDARKFGGVLENKKTTRKEQACDPNKNSADDDPDVGILSCGLGNYCVESQTSALGGICKSMDMNMDDHHSRRIQPNTAHPLGGGKLKNKKLVSKNECDPKIIIGNDAAIGLLACLAGQFCKESTESHLGGICAVVEEEEEDFLQVATRRMLYGGNYGNYTPPDFSMGPEELCDNPSIVCDSCDSFDFSSGSGTLNCEYIRTCRPCTGICLDKTGNFTFEANETVAANYCTYFVLPYELKACYSFDIIGENPTYAYAFDDVECSYRSPGNVCTEFDCTNVPNGQTGNSCDGVFPMPIIQDLVFTAGTQCFNDTIIYDACMSNKPDGRGYVCDCESVDLYYFTGSFTCKSTSISCFDDANTTCLSGRYFYTASTDGLDRLYEYGICYNRFAPAYNREFCYSSASATPDEEVCTVDGVACNFCKNYYSIDGNSNCREFDCLNTVAMSQGGKDTEDGTCDFIGPFINELFHPSPSTAPSMSSSAPSVTPSLDPSNVPSPAPSSAPSATPSSAPSSVPTSPPSSKPSSTPSSAPSSRPSSAPSSKPSSAPSVAPSPDVSMAPSEIMVEPDSMIPRTDPIIDPDAPTAVPTTSPDHGQTTFKSSQAFAIFAVTAALMGYFVG